MIYLDNNATTKLDDEVLNTMLPYLREEYGNASSIQHKMGRQGNQAIEQARKQIAQYLHSNPKEIFITSGATESINTVIKGIFERYHSIGNHIITCQTEHKAVLTTCEMLEKKGASITYLPVDKSGKIKIETLEAAITKETILVTIMSTNNESGIIQPIAEIARLCNSKGVLFFCDATQSIGKHKIDLSDVGIDILCFSAHKFHGPKGIGGLFIRRKSKPIQIESLIVGGKQENSFRGGTYNVANIVGMGKAVEILAKNNLDDITKLRDYFEQCIEKEIDDCEIIGKNEHRVGNTSNILFTHVKSSELMTKLADVAVSSGSACVSGDRDPSHVLLAMHLKPEEALSCIRFSFSKYNTKEEIDKVVYDLKENITKIRASSPIWQMYKAGLLD